VEDQDRRDDLEAAALYDLVEKEVAARFYDRDEHGLPIRWLEMVRHTLKSLGPKVLSTRMLRDYVTDLYVPTVRSARALNDDFAGARALAEWKARLRAAWDGVRIEHVEASGVSDSPQLGDKVSFQVYVALGELSPDDVDVQVVHGRA